MTAYPPRYWHGGVPGLRPGDLIEPRKHGDTGHLVEGCPTCDARRKGEQVDGDDNDPTLVYVTTDRDYARVYAFGYPLGALYRVEPIGELVDRSENDPVPSWGCSAARVLSVYDAMVVLDRKQVRKMALKFLRS